MQEQKKVLPTFNKNKRPHQALFAHPNNENSSNANFKGNFPSSSAPNYRPNKHPRTSQYNQDTGRPQPLNNNNNNRGQPWNSSFSDRGHFPVSSHPNPWTSSSSALPTHQGFGGWAPPPAAGAEGINSSWQRWAGVNSTAPPNRFYHPPTRAPPPPWSCPGQALPPRFPSPPNPPNQTSYRPQNNRPQLNMLPSPSPWPSSSSSFQQKSGNAEKQQAGYVVDDRSLKVLTASIADMRSWSQHVDKIGTMVCEVFGVMNSAISSDVNGVAKMFSLKDEDQTLKCIFYETDRPLPRLTRDHWLRCMGSLDHRSGLFRCVSVRPASQAEQQVMKSLTAASSSVMRECLVAVQEP